MKDMVLILISKNMHDSFVVVKYVYLHLVVRLLEMAKTNNYHNSITLLIHLFFSF